MGLVISKYGEIMPKPTIHKRKHFSPDNWQSKDLIHQYTAPSIYCNVSGESGQNITIVSEMVLCKSPCYLLLIIFTLNFPSIRSFRGLLRVLDWVDTHGSELYLPPFFFFFNFLSIFISFCFCFLLFWSCNFFADFDGGLFLTMAVSAFWHHL